MGPWRRFAAPLAVISAANAMSCGNALGREGGRKNLALQPGFYYSQGLGPYKYTDQQTGRLTKKYAQCLYGREPDKIDDFLLKTDPMNASVGDRFENDSIPSKCLGKSGRTIFESSVLSMPGTVFRALMTEAAYLASHSAPTDLPKASEEFLGRKAVADGSNQEFASALMGTADCLVFRDSAGADRLLRTDPGSELEMSQARALAPTLGQCLAADQTMKMTPRLIRMLAADGLWARYARTVH
jgi:hypothetical protein